MKAWSIELIQNNSVQPIELEASKVIKVDFNELKIDGEYWYVPEDIGMSFGEIEVIKGKQNES